MAYPFVWVFTSSWFPKDINTLLVVVDVLKWMVHEYFWIFVTTCNYVWTVALFGFLLWKSYFYKEKLIGVKDDGAVYKNFFFPKNTWFIKNFFIIIRDWVTEVIRLLGRFLLLGLYMCYEKWYYKKYGKPKDNKQNNENKKIKKT
jgi:hypothetical protein